MRNRAIQMAFMDGPMKGDDSMDSHRILISTWTCKTAARAGLVHIKFRAGQLWYFDCFFACQQSPGAHR